MTRGRDRQGRTPEIRQSPLRLDSGGGGAVAAAGGPQDVLDVSAGSKCRRGVEHSADMEMDIGSRNGALVVGEDLYDSVEIPGFEHQSNWGFRPQHQVLLGITVAQQCRP